MLLELFHYEKEITSIKSGRTQATTFFADNFQCLKKKKKKKKERKKERLFSILTNGIVMYFGTWRKGWRR